jgi:hypothetical protein
MKEFTIIDYKDPTKAFDQWHFLTDFDMTQDWGEWTSGSGNARKGILAEASALVDKILALPGINTLYICCHCITVTKKDSADWDQVAAAVREAFRAIYERTVVFEKVS